MKIKTFDKQNLKQIRVDLDNALNDLGGKYGIKLSVGTIRFEGTSFRTTLSAMIADATVNTVPGNAAWQKNFKRHVAYNNIFKKPNTINDEKVLGQFIQFRNEKHQIVGAMGRNASGPMIILANSRGKFIRVDEEAVVAALANS